ncbi:SatD family protein [Nocardioides sp.]|uniref:SatD family protein n=1 Tax=Nocardioides sp. TaxID=35761 RepID=UPI003517D9E9
MEEMKHLASWVVIGDVVASRRQSDRAGLHARLVALLEESNRRWGTDLRLTVGDEYQGTVPGLGVACALTLHLRLALLPDVDVRHGIGWGATAVLDPGAGIEDGPGWWAARAAIEEVATAQRTPATRAVRTAVRAAEAQGAPPAALLAAVSAALLGRDALLDGLDARGLSVVRGLLRGMTQQEIAAQEGVSASAVSQRVRRDRTGLLVAAARQLEAL